MATPIYAYAVTNLCTGLAASAFSWNGGTNDSTRSRLNDGKMSEPYVNGASVATLRAVVIDFGSAVTLTGIAILNSNCAVQKTDARVLVTGADDAAMSVNAVVAKAQTTLNSTAPKNKDHVLQFGAVTKRYWQLFFAWTGNVTNFQIGEIFAFNAQAQLTRRAIYGDGEGRTFKTAEVEYYNGGTRGFRLGGPVRSLRLPFSDHTDAQNEALYTMLAAVNGGASPFLWINSYEAGALAAANAEQEVIYGRITSPEFAFSVPDYQLFNPNDLLIKSLGREIGA